VEAFKGSNVWDEVVVHREFPYAETAILLCDVWDKHWCTGASKRVDEMAPIMDSVIKVAREKGVQIIHAPSDTMDFYADTPHRKRVLDSQQIEPPDPIDIQEPPLPIDDSDGGCDTGAERQYKAWSSQHAAIEIVDDDIISDNGREIYSYMKHRGIENLIIMGVHTNMCVLGRSFGIRQMTRWGVRCVLVRDLTDAMYNPERAPYVTHKRGTELVVEHIEKYWCPTIVYKDIIKEPGQ
jgi:nicotinamidase-related amidase